MRLQGVAYEDIARAGGGSYLPSMLRGRTSETQLFELAVQRLQNWLREGVSTLEIKSGYGLTLEDEARCLRVIRRLQQSTGLTYSVYVSRGAQPAARVCRAQ